MKYRQDIDLNDYIEVKVDNLMTEILTEISEVEELPSGDWTMTQDIKLAKVMAELTELVEEYRFTNSL